MAPQDHTRRRITASSWHLTPLWLFLTLGCGGDGSGAQSDTTATTQSGGITNSTASNTATGNSTSATATSSAASSTTSTTTTTTSGGNSNGSSSSSSGGMGSTTTGVGGGSSSSGGGSTTGGGAPPFSELQLGWNLGNSLDAPEGETSWGNPAVSNELLAAVAAAGFDVVRIPVTWSLHLGAAPQYTIEQSYLDRVTEIVNWVIANGMHAIINLHHDGADGLQGVEWLTLNDTDGMVTEANNTRVREQFVAIWQQIAAHFANADLRLWFESMNEIHDGYDAPDPVYYDIVNSLNQVFVDTVRQSGGNNAERRLVVPGYNTNIEYTVAGFQLPTDTVADKLILSAHYYDPWDFAGAGTTTAWGANSPGSDSWGQEDHVVRQFDALKTNYLDQGIPVILGEYGAVHVDGSENYRRYYMEYVTKAAHDRGILPIYWDNGGTGSGSDAFGLIDRNTLSIVHPSILEAMQRATRDNYALGDVALP